eukprot:TRINITY_DN49244_c0_g1_i1.p1 TRINITY_DN49244_c0_g1~~TRINITY_DN49244_c0_g1_i1.p1  ORF type:complete len:1119 (+),score=303.26 TRINITY_DN49244_c0_g1_i1:193-3357(+)
MDDLLAEVASEYEPPVVADQEDEAADADDDEGADEEEEEDDVSEEEDDDAEDDLVAQAEAEAHEDANRISNLSTTATAEKPLDEPVSSKDMLANVVVADSAPLTSLMTVDVQQKTDADEKAFIDEAFDGSVGDEDDEGDDTTDDDEICKHEGEIEDEDNAGALKGKRKLRGKPVDEEGPKKPLSPYASFSQKTSPGVIEADPSLKSDHLALAKVLSVRWSEVPEDEKALMQAQYDEKKAAWDEEMKTYRTTESHKAFQARLRHWTNERELKKLEKREKKREGGLPKKPPSPFALFDFQVRAEESSKGLELSEIGKIVSERWAALPAEEQAEFVAKSKEMRNHFEEELAKYQKSTGFHEYLEQRSALEQKHAMKMLAEEFEGKRPRRPPPAAFLLQREQGIKGSIKDISEAFNALSAEQKQKYIEEAARLREAFQQDLETFNKSKDGLLYAKKMSSAKRDAELRCAKAKFLVGAPKRPPKAKSLFFKSRKESDLGGLSGSALTEHLEKLWTESSDADKKSYEEERARLLEDYNEKRNEFEKSDAYKAFEAVEARLNKSRNNSGTGTRTGKAARSGKHKAKAKAKQRQSVGVPRPESMPPPAPSVHDLWKRERRAAGDKNVKGAMTQEDRQRLSAQTEKAEAEHRAAMATWLRTPDGKKYARACQKLRDQKKVAKAESEFFSEGKPKKPPCAMFIFASSGEKPSGLVGACWNSLSAEEKGKWEAKRAKLMEEYDAKMDEFRKSKGYKRAVAAPKGSGSKGKGRGDGKGRGRAAAAAPAGMPKKPHNAFQFFSIHKKLSVILAAKAWPEASAEDRELCTKQAEEAKQKFEKELAVWKLTKEGKQYLRSKEVSKRKDREQKAKEKYLNAPGAPTAPKPPKAAYQLFVEATRKDVVKSEPGLSSSAQGKRLAEQWKLMDEAGRKPFEDEAAASKAEYDKQMQAYKASSAYKKFAKAAGKGGSRTSKKARELQREREEYDDAMAAVYGGTRKARKVSSESGPSGVKSGGGGRGRGRGARGRGRGGKQEPSLNAMLGLSDDEMGSDSDSALDGLDSDPSSD